MTPELVATAAPPARAQEGLPYYMTEVYDWAYVDPGHVAFLDRNIVVKTLLFGNDQRLMRAYLDRIQPGMRVWQLAHVYGDLVQRAAERVGSQGQFTLTDVTPVQLVHANRKLRGFPWARMHHADAAHFTTLKECDLICSFFLLHEVPDDWKRRIVDNMLRQIPEGGEAIFVDYHRPAWWHPLRLVLKWVNRCLEPFAEALWHHDIKHYATAAEDYVWDKRTIFGGVYQIVTVRHRSV